MRFDDWVLMDPPLYQYPACGHCAPSEPTDIRSHARLKRHDLQLEGISEWILRCKKCGDFGIMAMVKQTTAT